MNKAVINNDQLYANNFADQHTDPYGIRDGDKYPYSYSGRRPATLKRHKSRRK